MYIYEIDIVISTINFHYITLADPHMYRWSKTHPAIPAAPSNRVNQKDTQMTRIKLTLH